MKTTRYIFNIMSIDWKGTWHKSPKPQWVTTLSESMDGHRVELPAETISFRYDINGKLGHLSGTVGDEPAKILGVQVEDLLKNIQDKRCFAGGTFIR